jgi:hypothetical protein
LVPKSQTWQDVRTRDLDVEAYAYLDGMVNGGGQDAAFWESSNATDDIGDWKCVVGECAEWNREFCHELIAN